MRLGIVGPGLIWQKKHKAALLQLKEQFTVTAFCAATDRHKAQALGDFPEAAFETDLQHFLRRGDIDAIVVLTPIRLNAATAIAALQAGKDVFLEKPIAHNKSASEELADTVRSTPRHLWVLENAVYDPRWARLRELLTENVIGRPIYFEQVVHGGIDSDLNDRGGYGKTEWRIHPEYPLGHFFDGGIHQLAVLSSLFGQPAAISAVGAKLRPDFGEYGHLAITLSYSDSLNGTLSHSSVFDERYNHFTIWGTQGSVAIEEARLVINLYLGQSRVVDVPQADSHQEMWRTLALAIARAAEPVYSLSQARADLAAMLAVDQSLTNVTRVNLGPV